MAKRKPTSSRRNRATSPKRGSSSSPPSSSHRNASQGKRKSKASTSRSRAAGSGPQRTPSRNTSTSRDASTHSRPAKQSRRSNSSQRESQQRPANGQGSRPAAAKSRTKTAHPLSNRTTARSADARSGSRKEPRKTVSQKLQRVMRDATAKPHPKGPTRRPPVPGPAVPQSNQPERLQKLLAAAGLGSRRDCETLIEEGRVEVDRQVVTVLGTRVDPDKQEIRVDGEVLPRPKRHYFAVNKPTNVISTNADPDGRMRVVDLVGTQHRLFTVGRLDKSSEGLILVTNDGELANQLTHPRYGIEKTYRVIVVGAPSPAELRQLTEGVHLAEGVAKAKRVKFKKKHQGTSEIEMVLDEGRNREIRRLLARIGHKVLRLRRIAIGPLELGDLPTGGVRRLRSEEVDALYAAVERRP